MKEVKVVNITNMSNDERIEYIKKSNEESGNTVDCMNFNETMKGYHVYALNDANDILLEKGFTKEQIKEIKNTMRGSMNWAIDMMTMSEARKYYKTH